MKILKVQCVNFHVHYNHKSLSINLLYHTHLHMYIYIYVYTHHHHLINPSSSSPAHHHHHQLMRTPYSHMARSSPGYAHSLLAYNQVILGLCALPTRTQPSQHNYTTLYSSTYVYQHNAATQKSIITTYYNINHFSRACSQGIHF